MTGLSRTLPIVLLTTVLASRVYAVEPSGDIDEIRIHDRALAPRPSERWFPAS